MNDAVPVCVAESLRDLLADFAGLVERLTLSPFHDRRKRLAIYEFHHQKGNALVLANVEDSYDARMRQSPRGSRFPIKALTRLFPLTARQRRREDCLHSNNAINSGIARSKNASHGTLPQFIENLVAANVLREIQTRKRSTPNAKQSKRHLAGSAAMLAVDRYNCADQAISRSATIHED